MNWRSVVLNNMKLSTKIICGFCIVLFLMIAVGYSGFSGMSGVVDRVDKADDANKIVNMVHNARQHEKNFIIRRDKQYVDQVFNELSGLTKQANETKGKFKQETNLKQMDHILAQADSYLAAFKRYVALEDEKTTLMANMRARAREVIKELEDIRLDQKQQLQKTQ